MPKGDRRRAMPMTITHEDIFQSTSNGVVATDATGRILHVNQTAERILDIDARKSRGIPIANLLPLTGAQVMDCLATRRPRLGHPIIGKTVELVLNITLVERGDTLLGAVCNFQEMHQFESSIKNLESYQRINRQLETIFTSSFDGIWVCDGWGKVIAVNEASARLNGIVPAEVLGKTVGELVAGGLFDRSVTLEVIETRRQVSLMQYVKKTGRHLLATGTPAFDDAGEIFLVVVNERDMTQLNSLQEELAQTQMIAEKIKDELAELSVLELRKQEIVAESEPMRRILKTALKLGRMGASNILIQGESGTGKGLIAKFIHENSRRRKKPFIPINCAALPANLLEAELFGYEKGAFTGADERGKAGLFELAHEGTLFLDEIGDMPLTLQAKLLKYLDDHEIVRLGGTRRKTIDCPILAAPNKHLEAQVRKRRFRQDLYYRLNTFSIDIPPLRQRPEDIFELSRHFLARFNAEYGTDKKIGATALGWLQGHPFPGKVRELKNLIK